MKKGKRNIYIAIAITGIILGSIFIKLGVDTQKLVPVYSYTAQKGDEYEVVLKPNTFYETPILPSGRYYAANSIDNYSINFKYDFKGNKNTEVQYNYNITAELIGTVKDYDNQDIEIWNRNFVLHENTENKLQNIDNFVIDDKVNIDYEYYNNLARSYEKTYDITIEAVLKVCFKISYVINVDSLDVQSEKVDDVIELDIPVTSKISEVKENYEKITVKDITPQNENSKLYRNVYCIMGGVFIIIAILMIILLYKKRMSEDIYNITLKRILRNYKDLIVIMINKPELTGLKIINVPTIDDLVNVADQTHNNILYYKDESKFYIIAKDYAYIYVLKV